jgi:hypothetical protein
MDTAPSNVPEAKAPKWRALNSRQRRVLGVLIEKAKTTPDAYPMTLNSLMAGCNQKSNRAPQMNLSTDDVEVILEELREMGAVVEVQTSGPRAQVPAPDVRLAGRRQSGIGGYGRIAAARRADGRRTAGPCGADGTDPGHGRTAARAPVVDGQEAGDLAVARGPRPSRLARAVQGPRNGRGAGAGRQLESCFEWRQQRRCACAARTLGKTRRPSRATPRPKSRSSAPI